MADALLSALASTILTNLNSLVLGEFAIAGGLKTELINLESTFTTIQAVLHDAEEKQWKDDAIKNWLRKLKDAAYEADDLLDEFAIHAQRRRQQRNQRRRVRVRLFFSHENPVVYRLKIAHKLKSVREKLDAIASEKHKFHLREVVIEDRGVGILDWRLTTSLVNESEIIGRKNEKEELISMLLNNSEDLSVCAICGMGGLGKTTLAQLVYNDERVERHFDLRIWVCVSDDFDLRRLTRAILESIDGCPPSCQELETLQRKLQEKLSGKKFFLILDDVWNEEHDKWDGLNNAIRCGATGSVVALTTRNEKIALMMATAPICYIGRLSDDDAWSLFEERAFGLGSKGELIHLETIGRDIVKKCGGVPLAIKAMGSLMRLKRKESEWLSVKESEIWELPVEGRINILPALRLSYNHLAPHLKECFAFCSIFPKDYEMKKDKLIGLWMANGFITCKGQMDLHDKGQEIFDELVWRSFFQNVGEDCWGNTTCKMHDLIHDLAQSIMKDECKLMEPNQNFQVSKMVRHLSFYWNYSDQYFSQSNNLFKDQSLRSFIWHSYGGCGQHIASYLSGQKHLRVLDLSDSNFMELPMSFERLKHLTYLDLSDSGIKVLPESTSSLQNMQTLNLRNCWQLYKLPKGMKHMTNLMYLDITSCRLLSYMPAEMGQLTHLRKLSFFIVGKDKGHGIGELKGLNLGGNLSIKNLDHVKSFKDAKNANLMQKKDLKVLSLCWSGKGEDNSSLSEETLDGLQPHSNLKQLALLKYRGSKFSDWMMEMDLILPNLVEIKLNGCDRCEHLPPFGKLKFLKNLVLCRMDGVKCIGNDIYGNGESSFPSLERLYLYYMGGLEEWKMVGGRDLFPVLINLSIIDCPKLVDSPIIPSVKTLELSGGSYALIKLVRNFTSITILELTVDYPKLAPLPIGQHLSNLKSLSKQLNKLASLKTFKLKGCKEVEILLEGFWSLNSLEKIIMNDCGVESFPPINGFGGLSSLRVLWFTNCERLTSLSEGMKYLTGIEDLCFQNCPMLNSLPESIGHLTSLLTLTILSCDGFSSLPNQIGNLVSLSSLKFYNCANLMCLPDEISKLKKLNVLLIKGCPVLQKRCQKDSGEDWPKIAHIPNIDI